VDGYYETSQFKWAVKCTFYYNKSNNFTENIYKDKVWQGK